MDHRLCGTHVVVNLGHVAVLQATLRRIFRVDLQDGQRETVRCKVAVLVEEPVLPVEVGPVALDQEPVRDLLRLLARGLQPGPASAPSAHRHHS